MKRMQNPIKQIEFNRMMLFQRSYDTPTPRYAFLTRPNANMDMPKVTTNINQDVRAHLDTVSIPS